MAILTEPKTSRIYGPPGQRKTHKWRTSKEYIAVDKYQLRGGTYRTVAEIKKSALEAERMGMDVVVVKHPHFNAYYYYPVSLLTPKHVSTSRKVLEKRYDYEPMLVMKVVGYWNPFWKSVKTLGGWLKREAGEAKSWVGRRRTQYTGWRQRRAREAYLGRRVKFLRERAKLKREKKEAFREKELEGLREKRLRAQLELREAQAARRGYERELAEARRADLAYKYERARAKARMVAEAAETISAGTMETFMPQPRPVAQPKRVARKPAPAPEPVTRETVTAQAHGLLGPILGSKKRVR